MTDLFSELLGLHLQTTSTKQPLRKKAFFDEEALQLQSEERRWHPRKSEMEGMVGFKTQQAKKPPSLAKPQETVMIAVGRGADSQTYKIHKDTLCYHSPFFATAFNGPFLEGETQVMTLDDVDSNVFGLLVAWLYTKAINDDDLLTEDQNRQTEAKNPTLSSNIALNLSNSEFLALKNLSDSGANDKFTTRLEALSGRGPELGRAMNALHLAKLWVLGQRFLIPDLQNCALSKMHSILALPGEGAHPQFKEITEYAYSGEYDELRMLVIEVLAFVDTQTPLEEFPKRILVDITKCLRAYCGYRKWGDCYATHQAEYFFVRGGTEAQETNGLGPGRRPPSPVWATPKSPTSTSYW